MSAREAALEGYFLKKIRLAGGLTVKLAPTEKGVPDRLVLMPGGRTYLVELKTHTGKLSPAQELWRYRATHLGTTVAVLYGPEQIDAWVRSVVSLYDPTPGRRRLADDRPVVAMCHSCKKAQPVPSQFAATTWLEERHAGCARTEVRG